MGNLPEGKLCTIREIDKQFNFSVAYTGVELMKGLAGVSDMGHFDGMLFDFGCNFSPVMTPKGLKFPVELAFITSGGEIAEIHTLDPEYAFTQGTVRRDIQYALEVPVGFFNLHGIVVGHFLQMDR